MEKNSGCQCLNDKEDLTFCICLAINLSTVHLGPSCIAEQKWKAQSKHSGLAQWKIYSSFKTLFPSYCYIDLNFVGLQHNHKIFSGNVFHRKPVGFRPMRQFILQGGSEKEEFIFHFFCQPPAGLVSLVYHFEFPLPVWTSVLMLWRPHIVLWETYRR